MIRLSKLKLSTENLVLIKGFIKGSLFLSIGNILSRLLISVSLILLARILTVSQFGEFSVLKSTIDSFIIFATAGLSFSATNFTAKFSKGLNKVRLSKFLTSTFQTSILIGTTITLLIILFSRELSYNAFGSYHLSNGLKIVALTIFFTSINAIQLGVLTGLEAFKSNMIIQLTQGVFMLIFLTLGGAFYGYMGAIIGLLITMLFTFTTSYIVLKTNFNKVGVNLNLFKFDKSFILVVKYTLPLFLSSILTTPVMWVLTSLVVKSKDGFEQIALYNATYILPAIVLVLNKIISTVLTPYLLSKNKLNVKEEFFTQLTGWFICIYISLFIICFPEIIVQIFANKFNPYEIKQVLIPIIGSILIISHRQGISINLLKKNKTKYSLFSMSQWAITSVLIFCFIERTGAAKLAYSVFLGYIINTIIFIPFFVKKGIAKKEIYFSYFHLFIFVCSILFILTSIYLPQSIPARIFIYLSQSVVIFLLIRKFYSNVS